MTTSEVLRAASEFLTPHTWGGGDYSGGGSSCVLIATWDAQADDPDYDADLVLARCLGYAGRNLDEARAHVYAYNDEPTRTLAEIHALLDRAIAAQELEEAFAAPAVSERTEVLA